MSSGGFALFDLASDLPGICALADDIQDRVLGCYIDYNTLQIFNPKQTTVQDTFFYNGHSVLHGSAMRGLIYRDNTCAFPIGRPRWLCLRCHCSAH